jgi:hypothetical protein
MDEMMIGFLKLTRDVIRLQLIIGDIIFQALDEVVDGME